MTTDTAAVDALRAACLAARPDLAARPWLPPFRFGSTPAGADGLLALVLAGTKTTTSLAVAAAGVTGEPLPFAGSLSIVLDGAGRPRCVIETIETTRQPLSAVDEAFAHAYGEGDRTRDWWLREMGDYYREEFAALGLPADPDPLLCCERFRVVHVAAEPGGAAPR